MHYWQCAYIVRTMRGCMHLAGCDIDVSQSHVFLQPRQQLMTTRPAFRDGCTVAEEV